MRGESYVELLPDRVAMQDATAQMALLQFMTAGLPQVRVPTTVHCDHLIQAKVGASVDLGVAEEANKEVYDFLRTVSARYGIGFWQPGSGIIHQVVLEKYAFPGGLMIGTDSHTPNAGGLGMVAIGVGGADAVDVMTGGTFGLRWPSMIGVRLTGSMSGWTSPKDVILRVAQILTVSGGTGAIVEYFGPGVAAVSATGRATICNMGAEIGATTSVFPFDERSVTYLVATGGPTWPKPPEQRPTTSGPTTSVDDDPPRLLRQGRRDRPHHPRAPRRRAPDARPRPERLRNGRRGEGRGLAAQAVAGAGRVVHELVLRGHQPGRQPGPPGVGGRAEGQDPPAHHARIGAGQGHRRARRPARTTSRPSAPTCWPTPAGPASASGPGPTSPTASPTRSSRRSTVTSPAATTATPSTLAFVASPETTIAYALAGTLDFNPLTDEIDGVRLNEPIGDELPVGGFVAGVDGYVPPPAEGGGVDVVIDPQSSRLQRLEPFPPWDGDDFVGLRVLLKAVGKCTTDHISAAGRWLRFRGHLENISGNLFLGAVNAFTGEPGVGICGIHGATEPLPEVARHYRDAGEGWVAVGDANYGEGSSREHAAMEPRFMGGKVIMVRSFARIAETNLKKQGVLPLVFADPATYDLIGADDRISVLGLAGLAPGVEVTCRIERPDGSSVPFLCTHSLSEEHVEWFRAGSALNLIRLRFSPSPSEA